MQWILHFVRNAALIVIILVIARQFEKRNPIEPNQSISDIIVDWKLSGLKWISGELISPFTKLCTITIVASAGGGFIPLRTDGWWYLFSFVVLILAMDFWGYLVHRAQHKFPVLWSMHSLHHSAEALSVVTGARHFWLEEFITSACFPVLWIIFKVPSEIVISISLFYIATGEVLAHLNMRMSLGRFTLVFNNPQFHRIHHSVEPQHHDKNFSNLLPLFDIIFGTAWKPEKDEFPKTGLATHETASGFIDGFVWPLRNIVPRAVRTP